MKIYKGRFIGQSIFACILWCIACIHLYMIDKETPDTMRTIAAMVFLGVVFGLMIYSVGHSIIIYRSRVVVKNQFNFFDKVGKTFYIKDIKMIHIFESGRGNSITIYLNNGKKKLYSIAIPKLDDLQRDLEEQGVKVKRGW